MRYVTREEMQEIDRRAIEERGIPVDRLMGAAGKAVADLIEERISRDCPIVAVCGRGNNGGDGFVAARLLAERGFEVEVLALQRSYDPATATGRAWEAAQDADIHFAGRFKRRPMTCLIDAIFGTGLSREVVGEERELIRQLNAFDKRWSPIVAVDIPSGLEANSGRPLGIAVEAAATVTMGLPKVGFRSPEAKKYVGELLVADIGFPADLLR
ncbi:MAG TPA: NAD(P)H-hydrate epimerase [Planctomycetota bacterium]|nr:NAD(P)H-hydrate epimerase [Planctomycetota bacterium]